MAASTSAKEKDWSAAQYLKFAAERTRPVRDLISHIPPSFQPQRILDLGCGPGNSTAVLRETYPAARIIGVDSSPDMIARAKQTVPDTEFVVGDLVSYDPDAGSAPSAPSGFGQPDLIFANAVYQWLEHESRVEILQNLIGRLRIGGVFAFQVPYNFSEPTHVAMRTLAARERWGGKLGQAKFPWRKALQAPPELYEALKSVFESIDVWETTYWHWLEGHGEIVEWVRGTGLRPFEEALEEGEERKAFLDEYRREVEKAYKVMGDGKVGLRYPRLFFVGTKG